MQCARCCSCCRYVTRQGQGARQSSQDKTGKYANSMGSQLRRHNEVSLEREIIATLSSWDVDLQQCDLIFVHAPAANAKAVFGSPALDRSNPRVRPVPFTTSRPTLAEVRRVLAHLASMEVVPADQVALLPSTPATLPHESARSSAEAVVLQAQKACCLSYIYCSTHMEDCM
jgi:hypothetical protein